MAYFLQIKCGEGTCGLIFEEQREFHDINFDGFVDFEEYVRTLPETVVFLSEYDNGTPIATFTGAMWTTEALALLDFDGDSSVEYEEFYRFYEAVHVWNAMTDTLTGEINSFEMPADFDEVLFKYYDQDLNGIVLVDEFYTAAYDSRVFANLDDNFDFELDIIDLGYTRIENEWIDLNADDLVDINEWQLSYIDRHQFFINSQGNEVMTTIQATRAGYSSSDQVLLDANSDGSITFVEYAAYITADRDWEFATNGGNILTYAASISIGKSQIEWEFMDTDFSGDVNLAEWQAARSILNEFLSVKDDDTIDEIPIATLETHIGNDTLNLWYDENADDTVSWTEWMNYVLDIAMWDNLDADEDHHVTPAELVAMGFNANMMLDWLDTPGNGDLLIDFAEYQVGAVNKNKYDVAARADSESAQELELIDDEEFDVEEWPGVWDAYDANNDDIIDLNEWMTVENLIYDFTQVDSYDDEYL